MRREIERHRMTTRFQAQRLRTELVKGREKQVWVTKGFRRRHKALSALLG